MSCALSTVTPKLFKKESPGIVFETSSDDSLDAGHLRSLLNTVMSEGAIGISASYRANCQLSAIAFSSPSRALVVHLTNGDLSVGGNRSKRSRIIQGRKLLEEQILCNADYHKYAFRMDRIAIALYLDMALRIDRAVDMLSVSLSNRRSLQALADAMGGWSTLHQSNVKALFFNNESGPIQAWAACQAAILPDMAVRFHTLRRIRTNTMPDDVLAKISRDAELLDSLKPHTVKNDVMPDITKQMDNLTLTCNRYSTRIRNSTHQIETRKGVQMRGRAIHVNGREAQIEVMGSLHDDKIKSVTTIGKEDLTFAETCRENVISAILREESTLLSHPFVRAIWFPGHQVWWLPSSHLKPKIPICCANLEINPSQERAVEKILSAENADRLVLIQGPPGTGKTTVITAAVTSIISCPDASNRTVWIAAQSNVAVKNIAEKFAKIDFYDFSLLVSKEFHFDWHEHLYEKLEPCLIRSDAFSDDIVGASRQLRGARVILCTIGMLSNCHIAPFVHVNPVDILIFDEGSQIEVGSYVPVFHRFEHTLEKIVFIGDDKQYRMPSAIGDFISREVYDGKLKTCHTNSVSLPCRFVDVRRGQEKRSGKSWVNPLEARVIVKIASAYQAQELDFRIITPYDAQRSLIEHELQAANRRTNVMLSRCKMAMLICTSQPFVQGPAASTLIGRLATALGPEAWLYEDVRIQPIMPSWGIALPHPNIYLTAHHPTFRNVADRQTRDFHALAVVSGSKAGSRSKAIRQLLDQSLRSEVEGVQ
ncbi:P-loop containing nucleoside triphosphate hydrolase protein [Pisolithus sp. B1]|nr:P-loop containing nucleoside triphosphate hydrolase protein [Pisolithus sp. B1]